jgi:hypothetical protein
MLRSLPRLRALGRGDRPIVAGPFISEVGFEALYWIPMLRWLAAAYDIPPERITVFSRGGADSWYAGVAGSYLDVFDYLTPEELRDWHERRIAATRSQKQMAVTEFDRDLVGLAGDRVPDGAELLHPSLMYQLFRLFWNGRGGVRTVTKHTDWRELPDATGSYEGLADLPEDFVAVKAYFSGCFPDTPENRAWLRELIERLARTGNVVLLSTGIDLDEHADFRADDGGSSIQTVEHLMTPRNNLDVQTAVTRRARALFTTYGGFAHLGPFLGVPTFGFASLDNFNASHLDIMRRAVRTLGKQGTDARFALLDTRQVELLEMALGSASAAPAR